MTNQDKIKNMSVEEMAKMLHGICPYNLDGFSENKEKARQQCLSHNNCDKCRKHWLESEMEE